MDKRGEEKNMKEEKTEKEMLELETAAEILRRAYKWFGVKAPTKYTFALRDDYYATMKAYSAWVRADKTENPEWWAEWKA